MGRFDYRPSAHHERVTLLPLPCWRKSSYARELCHAYRYFSLYARRRRVPRAYRRFDVDVEETIEMAAMYSFHLFICSSRAAEHILMRYASHFITDLLASALSASARRHYTTGHFSGQSIKISITPMPCRVTTMLSAKFIDEIFRRSWPPRSLQDFGVSPLLVINAPYVSIGGFILICDDGARARISSGFG